MFSHSWIRSLHISAVCPTLEWLSLGVLNQQSNCIYNLAQGCLLGINIPHDSSTRRLRHLRRTEVLVPFMQLSSSCIPGLMAWYGTYQDGMELPSSIPWLLSHPCQRWLSVCCDPHMNPKAADHKDESEAKWRSFPGAQTAKNPPVMQETRVWSLGWEDPLEKEMSIYSSILVWRSPWTEESGGLQSMS